MLKTIKVIGLRLKAVFEANDGLAFLGVFTLFFGLFALVYFSLNTVVSLDDHFFHFRFAQIIREHGSLLEPFRDFKWIYFSKIAQDNSYFIYYNFLFYLIILPFTYISPLFLAIKLYAIVAASLVFSSLFYVLRKLRQRWAFWWALAIPGLMGFPAVWRFLLARPYALAPAFLLIIILLMHQKRYRSLAVVSAAYFFWHFATWYFPLLVAIPYLVMQKFYRQKADWWILCSVGLGTLLAGILTFAISPGFLYYSKELVIGIYTSTILGKKIIIPEGNELYPVNFFDFFRSNWTLCSFFLMASVLEIYRYIAFKRFGQDNPVLASEQPNQRVLQSFLFAISIAFFLGTIVVSARFAEFFFLFSGLYIVLSLNLFIRFIRIDVAFARRALATAFVILVIYSVASNGLFLQQLIAQAPSYRATEGAATWLKTNTKPGQIVFNADWSWFPTLFFYDSQNYYITGLEPRYLYDYNHRLYWLWQHISIDGYVCETEKCLAQQAELDQSQHNKQLESWGQKEAVKIAQVVRQDFQSEYIITDRKRLLTFIMANNPQLFKEVYKDDNFLVYHLLP